MIILSTTYPNAPGELIEPQAISYSFNTPGWHMILVLLLVAVLLTALFQYRKYRRNAYRRAAVQQIENLANSDSNTAAYEINRCLKITAIDLFGRKQVAALAGTDWFHFLQKTMKSNTKIQVLDFQKISTAIYDSSFRLSPKEKNEWLAFAILWLKKHEVKHV